MPTYDPWIVYGAPLGVWPGWYSYPGSLRRYSRYFIWLGFGVGFFGGFGWGWHNWGFDWGHRTIIFNHTTYISHSRTFINRNSFNHNPRAAMPAHGSAHRPGPAGAHAFAPGQRGFSAPTRPQAGVRGASGFNHGGVARSFSSGGHASSGGFHDGGGFHGGGGRR